MCKQTLDELIEKGLNATNIQIKGKENIECELVFDKTGMIFRSYDELEKFMKDNEINKEDMNVTI